MNTSVDSRWQFGKNEDLAQQRLPSISELITNTSTEYPAPPPPPSTQPSTSFPSSRSDSLQACGEITGHMPIQGPHSKLLYPTKQAPVPLSGEASRLSFTTQLNPPSIPWTTPHAHTPSPAPALGVGEYSTPEAFLQAQMPPRSTSPRRCAPQDWSASGEGNDIDHKNGMKDTGTGNGATIETSVNSMPCSYTESLSRVSQPLGQAAEGQEIDDPLA